MANRSTFNRALPRDLGKLASLSQSPSSTYTKEQRQLHKGAGPEGYERALRMLFIDAHGRHRAHKLSRLAREVVAELKEDVAAAAAATVSTT